MRYRTFVVAVIHKRLQLFMQLLLLDAADPDPAADADPLLTVIFLLLLLLLMLMIMLSSSEVTTRKATL